MWSHRDVVSYLMNRKLVSAESIAGGDLKVSEASRRNHNFEVIRRRGPSYFVKQAVGEDRIETLAREASVYEALGSKAWLARCHGYDAAEHVLILERVGACSTLGDYQRSSGRFPVAIAKALAE